MKLVLATGAWVLFGTMAVSAQTNAPSSAVAGNPAAITPVPPPAGAPKKVIFRPPGDESSGLLPIRVGGGSRGGPSDGLSLEVLVPDQVALTTQSQPSLYWFQSKAAKTTCEVTLTEPKKAKPLLVLKSSQPTPEGIHAVHLSRFKVELKPNVLYRWSVAVVVDGKNRSEDIVANGLIKRIDPAPALNTRLSQSAVQDKPALYAENGIWYDALQSISDQIDHAPQDAALRDERDALLKQIGMDGAKMESSTFKAP